MKNHNEFSCRKCGECCKGVTEEAAVLLFPDDLVNISMKMGLTVTLFESEYCNKMVLQTEKGNVWITFLMMKNNRCVFLTKDNICSIHEYKPIQCREKPFNIFWNKARSKQYDCMKDYIVPDNWNTDSFDCELIKSLKI